MAKAENWYDRQANISKLITYAALLVLLGSIGWAGFSAWQEHKIDQATPATLPAAGASATSPEPGVIAAASESKDYHLAMFSVIGGVTAAAFLIGVSAIIDLLIVQCEGLRTRR